MKRSELKEFIKECIKEVMNELNEEKERDYKKEYENLANQNKRKTVPCVIMPDEGLSAKDVFIKAMERMLTTSASCVVVEQIAIPT